MRILAIHGVGHADAKTDWQPGWRQAVADGLRAWNPSAAPELEFLVYDPLFESQPLDTPLVVGALARLVKSGLFFGIGDRLTGRRGLGDSLQAVRWTAGMVAQWVALDGLRLQLRNLLAAKVRAFAPDAIIAHSLGSLIAYDTFRRDEVANPQGALIAGRTFLSFGSQIGNAAVRATFGGRIEALEGNRFWWHLFNREDDVFTAPLALPSEQRFRQIDTFFDIDGMADHDGAHYLAHPQTLATVWQDLASSMARGRRAAGAGAAISKPTRISPPRLGTARKSLRTRPRARALLVGIAEYADPSNTLEGPVNDVFGVSATLQELGFDADDIRVVLNERATTAGIRERLKWLLEDAHPGDQLVFFFAGHGAQIPGYGRDAEVDRVDECLVPYDFDWSAGHAILDDEFAALYSQLPYEAQFTAILDCCHSGGIARAGGVRARGLVPPDDIRHRSLRWDRQTQMWLPRKILAENNNATAGKRPGLRSARDRNLWTGKSGSVRRLGRGTSLWLPTDRQYRRAKDAAGHRGPYIPTLLEACREGELAYEYRHGVTSHGAFTHALCGALRDAARDPRRSKRPLTYANLITEATRRVALVVSEPQHPQLQCAALRRNEPVPGIA